MNEAFACEARKITQNRFRRNGSPTTEPWPEQFELRRRYFTRLNNDGERDLDDVASDDSRAAFPSGLGELHRRVRTRPMQATTDKII
jgi:hypothetical protein